MAESLRDLISKSDNIYTVNICKPKRHDRSSWRMEVTDKRSSLYGKTIMLGDMDFVITTVRRGEHFFIAYKIPMSDGYFVDPPKAIHRSSVPKFVDGIKNYILNSNDISLVKNASSFKVTSVEMRKYGIDNFVELCYQYKEYSAIGIGYERLFRNMIVLDIDVDCDKKENAEELHRILCLFGNNSILPDFEIHNKSNGHVQLQWLIKSLRIKNTSDYAVKKLIEELFADKNKNTELNYIHYNFSEDTDDCGEYILFTRALTDISSMDKFGDKNFTFWKAKNFCTALFGYYSLELKMPYMRCGDIQYLSKEDMMDLFSTKEKRRLYYEEAPTFQQIKDNSKQLMEVYVNEEKPNLSKIKKEVNERYEESYSYKCNNGKESRNNFVLAYTRNMSWKMFRTMMFKSYDDISKLPPKEYRKLENKIKNIVKKEFKRKDEEYNGHWPGTTNDSSYTQKEFDMTFDTAFEYAKMKYNSSNVFSKESRDNSIFERGLKKDMKLIVVDYFRSNYKLDRNELLSSVNETLRESGKKEISFGSLKRYISILKVMDDCEKVELYNYYIDNLEMRKDNLLNINSNNGKYIDFMKKKVEAISINIVDNIMKSRDI